MLGNRVLNQFRVILSAGQAHRVEQGLGVAWYTSRPLTDFPLGSILYFKPDNSIHAPNRGRVDAARVVAGAEAGAEAVAGVAAGAARSISACKYAFELVYGHWSVHIAIQKLEKQVEGSRSRSRRGNSSPNALVVWFNGMCVCCLPWGLGQLLLMAWLTRFAADRDSMCGQCGCGCGSVWFNFHHSLAPEPSLVQVLPRLMSKCNA